MMKKLLFTLLMLAGASVIYAQKTYYWVGGTTIGNIGSGANWNTKMDGSGDQRENTSPYIASDILIIDGTNIGGQNLTPSTAGDVTINFNTTTTAQVKILNGASVVIARNNSNGTLTIANNTLGEAGLTIDATSSLQLGSPTLGYTGAVYIDFPSSTGSISGKIKLVQESIVAVSPRITSRTVGAIVLHAGSSFEYDNTSGYPFGTVGSGASNSFNYSFVFQSGANLITNSVYGPFGSNAASSIVDFKSGSNYYIRKTLNTGSGFSTTNQKTFGNVFIQNNSILTTDASALNKIENLTIDEFSSLTVGGSSSTPLPITGNLIVNGSINGISPGTTILVMGGNTPQSISGTGNINVTNFIVANHSDVTLNKDINVASAVNVYGKLDLSTFKINGDASFTSRVNFVPATITQSGATVTNGAYQISVPANLGLSALQGLAISGSGIPENTNIVSYSSSNGQINLSKPATASSTNVTLTFGSNTSTLATSNAAGFDEAIKVTGAKNFIDGTNYIFNAATSSPFPLANNNNLGNVTFNASASTNRDISIIGTLTLNNAKLTIRDGETVTASATAFVGGTYNNNAYVATEQNGKLLINGSFDSPKIIPVGTTSNYLPVILKSEDATGFSVNIFEGVTQNATLGGVPVTNKTNIVDVIWNINRLPEDSSPFMAILDWAQASPSLIGANLAGAEIGVAQYIGSAYTAYANTAYTANTVTAEFTENGPFSVGKLNTTLPVKLLSFTANAELSSVKLSWKTTSEKSLAKYIIQHKNDSSEGFKNIYTVAAHNQEGTFDYKYVDVNALAGNNYYRLISEDLDGTQYLSDVKSVNISGNNLVNVYPNPVINQSFNVSGLLYKDVIKIIDLKGQVIIQKNADGNNINSVNVSEIKPGVYVVYIENGGKITSSKRIVVL